MCECVFCTHTHTWIVKCIKWNYRHFKYCIFPLLVSVGSILMILDLFGKYILNCTLSKERERERKKTSNSENSIRSLTFLVPQFHGDPAQMLNLLKYWTEKTKIKESENTHKIVCITIHRFGYCYCCCCCCWTLTSNYKVTCTHKHK